MDDDDNRQQQRMFSSGAWTCIHIYYHDGTPTNAFSTQQYFQSKKSSAKIHKVQVRAGPSSYVLRLLASLLYRSPRPASHTDRGKKSTVDAKLALSVN
jgi:hypothetical protein